MDINELTLEAIQNYFKVLRRTGNIDTPQVNKLLLLSFIDELFQNYGWYSTAEEYTFLMNIVTCISKTTCIVPYNKTAMHIDPINNYLEDTPIRVSEDSIIRLSHNDVLRLSNNYNK